MIDTARITVVNWNGLIFRGEGTGPEVHVALMMMASEADRLMPVMDKAFADAVIYGYGVFDSDGGDSALNDVLASYVRSHLRTGVRIDD